MVKLDLVKRRTTEKATIMTTHEEEPMVDVEIGTTYDQLRSDPLEIKACAINYEGLQVTKRTVKDVSSDDKEAVMFYNANKDILKKLADNLDKAKPKKLG